MNKCTLIWIIINISVVGLSTYGVIIDHRFTKYEYSTNYTSKQIVDIDGPYIVSGPLNYACKYEENIDKAMYSVRLNISCDMPYIIINPQHMTCNYNSHGIENNITYTALCNTTYRLCSNNEYAIVLFNNTYNTTQNDGLTLDMSSYTVHLIDNGFPILNMIFILPMSIISLIVTFITIFSQLSIKKYRILNNKQRIISVNKESISTTESTSSSESTETTV